MKIFVTSDTHFGHENIMKYCARPFKSVEEMNARMIENWNAVVTNEDIVYHLGDFALGNTDEALKILASLRGAKILLKGNHDSRKIVESPLWGGVIDYLELCNAATEKVRYVMSHYPFKSWNGSNWGSINLHGHCHGLIARTRQQIDVGADCFNFTPVELLAIPKILSHYPEHNAAEIHEDHSK